MDQLADGVVPEGATRDGNVVSFTTNLKNGESKDFGNLPIGTTVKLSEATSRPKVKGVKFVDEVFKADNATVSEDKKSVEFTIEAGASNKVEVNLENPIEKDRSNLWWLLLLVPATAFVGWLISKIPGPTPPAVPAPGDKPTPGDKPAPGDKPTPGDKPAPGQSEQPAPAPAPGGERQTIQSVPSGATEKSDEVEDFIG